MIDLPKITQPFIENFEGDYTLNFTPRQTPDVLYALVQPQNFTQAKLLHYNNLLGETLGFKDIPEDLLTAQKIPNDIKPYATAYAGHQFGNWAGQLGDGRAIYIGEILSDVNHAMELQWKGAGLTPYSRTADGKAVLRSSIREYLMSEAMYYLGVPTTRALSLATTGENIVRDPFYNGNIKEEQGAIVVRVAESFLRFGHFELLAAREDKATMKKLADFVIERYYPEIQEKSDEKYTLWFHEITKRTIKMVVDWYRVGFVHGVMNTDNMSVLGLTIDYGPFAMLDAYDTNFTPNTTDLPGRRYAFGKQSAIVQWNLYKLANALLLINEDVAGFQKIVNDFPTNFSKAYQQMMALKFGLDTFKQSDDVLLDSFHEMMQEIQFDYTIFFSDLIQVHQYSKLQDFEKGLYQPISHQQELLFNKFLELYKQRIEENAIDTKEKERRMQANNPQFILRNYLLYQCIQEVEQGNMTLFHKLWNTLKTPYISTDKTLEVRSPDWAAETPGCSMLSCSS